MAIAVAAAKLLLLLLPLPLLPQLLLHLVDPLMLLPQLLLLLPLLPQMLPLLLLVLAATAVATTAATAAATAAAIAYDDALVAPWASGGSVGGPDKIVQTWPSVNSGWTSGDPEPCDSTVRAASASLAACMAAIGLPLPPRLPASLTPCPCFRGFHPLLL